jgi:DNA-binding protein H-NS
MEQDYKGKTTEELIGIIRLIKAENEKLREERNEQAVELKQHISRFSDLREQFAKLRNEVDLLVKRATKEG